MMIPGHFRRLLVLPVLCAALTFPAPWARAQQDSWPDLSVPPKAVGGGEHDAAVIVGADNYVFVEHVQGAKQNAYDWQAYLTGTLKVIAPKLILKPQ